MTDMTASISDLADKTLLLLDDDAPLRTRLGRALESRGFETVTAGSVAEALTAVRARPPAFAVLDMRLEDGNGLRVVEAINEVRPDARIVMLTGYGNIATAVAAVKAGAVDYLSKPADADDVARALLALPGESPPPPENPMSADRVRWEHIQRVFELCGHNVSETARRLNMHRRTLQRPAQPRAQRRVVVQQQQAAVREIGDSCRGFGHGIFQRQGRPGRDSKTGALPRHIVAGFALTARLYLWLSLFGAPQPCRVPSGPRRWRRRPCRS